ncbi:MAG: hypothetical protein OEZ04_05550 [Nitrospinota bacterium]|nr:hypothetical protein [Nitrospinota bacterium]
MGNENKTQSAWERFNTVVTNLMGKENSDPNKFCWDGEKSKPCDCKPYEKYICEKLCDGCEAKLGDEEFWKAPNDKCEGYCDAPGKCRLANNIEELKKYGTEAQRDKLKCQVLHTSFLEKLILDPFCKEKVHRNGIRIKNAYIVKDEKNSCNTNDEFDLSDGRIHFTLRLEDSYFHCDVNLIGLETDGLLSFEGSYFKGDIKAMGLHVRSQFFLREGAKFKGKVDLRSAHIESHLDMEGSIFADELLMSNIKVGGYLNMKNFTNNEDGKSDSEERKLVDLSNAHITAQADMSGAVFQSELNLTNARIEEHLSFNDAKVKGKLCMVSIKVGGNLEMKSDTEGSAEFKDVDIDCGQVEAYLKAFGAAFTGDRLDMNGLQAGALLFRAYHGHSTVIPSYVDLRFARIRQVLEFAGVKVQQRKAEEGSEKNLEVIDLTGTVIDEELRISWHEEATTDSYGVHNNWGNSKLILKNVRCHSLQDCENAWPEQGKLDLTGFSYNLVRSHKGGEERSIAEREEQWIMDWLEKSESYHDTKGQNKCGAKPPPVANFSAQPYTQLASVMQATGRDMMAARILYKLKERKRIHFKKEFWHLPFWGNIVKRWNLFVNWIFFIIQKYSIGYGFYNHRIAVTLLLFIWVGAFIALNYNPGVTSVKLEDLPSGSVISKEDKISLALQHKISYDASSKRLIYQGVMTEHVKDLLLMSTANRKYNNAVENLFNRSKGVYVNLYIHEFWVDDIYIEPFVYSLDKLLPGIRILTKEEANEIVSAKLPRGAELYFIFHQLAGWMMALLLAAGITGLTRK